MRNHTELYDNRLAAMDDAMREHTRNVEREHTFVPESAVKYFRSGAHKTQRFGQFYINNYMPSGTDWPELFYEEDNDKALYMILGISDENDSQP